MDNLDFEAINELEKKLIDKYYATEKTNPFALADLINAHRWGVVEIVKKGLENAENEK